ncbi:MAG: ion channel [Ilumatobacteraceae bacterium]
MPHDLDLGEQGPMSAYLTLLAAVILLFVLQASLADTALARAVQMLAAGTALLLAVRLADVSRRWRLAVVSVVALGVVAVVADVLAPESDASTGILLLVNGLLVAAGPPAIFRAIRRHRAITARTLVGAVTIFVLVGLFFAFVYRSLLVFDPTSFQASVGTLRPPTMQYLSFVTITTVGFGDVIPVSDLARTIVALEALVGQVYLVTVVALVVGNLGQQRLRRVGRPDAAGSAGSE